MKDVSDKNFGVIIAFLLPGFLLLWGLSFSSADIAGWLATASADKGANIGGFLYATLASLALGLIISAVRWLIIDSALHHIFGPARQNINFGKLIDKDAFAAFQGVVENHYRYYQYYSNTFVALVSVVAVYCGVGKELSGRMWIGVITIGAALFLASRDTLKKYYERAIKIAPP
jgi:hypothetical protein